jgi:zinc D-Ala-D-Ala carboxypeptidase
MNLTEHFTLAELIASNKAQELGINNTPPSEIMPALSLLAIGLESVRILLGSPMRINSGYRSPDLNEAVGGVRTSAHCLGWAADFICPGYGTPQEIVQRIAGSSLEFDQIICEGTWVHFSVAPALRRQVLAAHFGPGGATYTRSA